MKFTHSVYRSVYRSVPRFSHVHHMMFQKVRAHKRKAVESKHHGNLRTSEQQRFNQTEITFSQEKMEAIYTVVLVLGLW